MEQVVEWLLAPVDPSREHVVGFYFSWHARVMVLAWGVLAPLAIIIARFFKIAPGQEWPKELDNPFWWRCHWMGQALVVALSVLGLSLIFSAGQALHAAPVHKWLGYLILGFGAIQALSGVLRGTKGGPTEPAPGGSLRGDHYDMTPRRLVFEAVHKTLGYSLILAAVVCIVLGLWAANAPRWMWFLIPAWWAGLLSVAIWLQATRGACDTYQAIWGPDAAHPGNRMKKQGWGTVRPGDLPEFQIRKRKM